MSEEKHVSTLVIAPSGNQSTGSSSIQQSSSFSSSQSVSTSSSKSATSSSTTTSKTVVKKSSSTTVKSSSMKSSSIVSSSSSNISISSSGDCFSDVISRDLGMDVHGEMKKLRERMDQTVEKARAEMFSLCKLERLGSSDLIKLDNKSITDFVQKGDEDKLKFNFDVDEFESESISVKAVGNKIEVHGVKKSRKGDDETAEEFNRTYELPTDDAIDSSSVKSSFYKDGILTVELPFDAKAVKAN